MPDSIRQVKAKHQQRLLALPGVVSVGIGRDADGTPVIIVGLDRDDLRTINSIPPKLEGQPVRIEVHGRIRAQ